MVAQRYCLHLLRHENIHVTVLVIENPMNMPKKVIKNFIYELNEDIFKDSI